MEWILSRSIRSSAYNLVTCNRFPVRDTTRQSAARTLLSLPLILINFSRLLAAGRDLASPAYPTRALRHELNQPKDGRESAVQSRRYFERDHDGAAPARARRTHRAVLIKAVLS